MWCEMKDQEISQQRCPLRFQTGAAGVENFDVLLNRLPPEQRAAFEAERARLQAEVEAYIAEHGYRT
jgi:hypothetical protein